MRSFICVLISCFCWACSGQGNAEFDSLDWRIVPSPCGITSGTTKIPCLTFAEVDSLGNARAGTDSVEGNVLLTDQEVEELKNEMTSPDVINLYKKGCDNGPTVGDKITTSLKLKDQEKKTIDHTACQGMPALDTVDKWIGLIMTKTKPWT